MPVIRNYRYANGTVKTEVDPDYERRYREFSLSESLHPHYSLDPTYNLRKDRR